MLTVVAIVLTKHLLEMSRCELWMEIRKCFEVPPGTVWCWNKMLVVPKLLCIDLRIAWEIAMGSIIIWPETFIISGDIYNSWVSWKRTAAGGIIVFPTGLGCKTRPWHALPASDLPILLSLTQTLLQFDTVCSSKFELRSFGQSEAGRACHGRVLHPRPVGIAIMHSPSPIRSFRWLSASRPKNRLHRNLSCNTRIYVRESMCNGTV